jgi:hypothetical protein
MPGSNRLVVTRKRVADRLQLIAADSSAPITIEVTRQGIALKIDGPDVALHASGALSLSARRLVLAGSEAVEIAGGREVQIHTAGELRSEAGWQTLRASHGTIDVKASDDVKLSGERVMVNCDDTVNRYFRDSRELPSGRASPPEAGSGRKPASNPE